MALVCGAIKATAYVAGDPAKTRSGMGMTRTQVSRGSSVGLCWHTEQEMNSNFRLVDVRTGNAVMEGKLLLQQGDNRFRLRMADLGPGIYDLEFVTETGQELISIEVK